MTDLTEKLVRDRLLRLFPAHQNLVGFNLVGIGPYPHEMDFTRVTNTGYVQEFEIKVTASDIKAELTKAWKHDDLQNGVLRRCGPWVTQFANDKVGPSFMAAWRRKHFKAPCMVESARYVHPIREFYVVVPIEANITDFALLTLPTWMGIVEIDSQRNYFKDCVKRKPKILRGARKITDAERVDLLRRMMSRFWAMYHERGGMGRGTKAILESR